MNRKILYIDLNNVLVDFSSGIEQLNQTTKDKYEGNLDEVPYIFSLMKPIDELRKELKKKKEASDLF